MTICGTDEYMAPEMLFDESFSYPADMFSFGERVVTAQLLLITITVVYLKTLPRHSVVPSYH